MAIKPGDVTNIQVLVNKDTWEADLGSVEPGTVVIEIQMQKWQWIGRCNFLSCPNDKNG